MSGWWRLHHSIAMQATAESIWESEKLNIRFK